MVVCHSGYGHTKRMAESVAAGAQARLLEIDAEGTLPEPAWQHLDEADFVILGSPTYMGGPSWQFKKFADASSSVDEMSAGDLETARLYGLRVAEIAASFSSKIRPG